MNPKRRSTQSQLFWTFSMLSMLSALAVLLVNVNSQLQRSAHQHQDRSHWLVTSFVRDATTALNSQNWGLLHITLREINSLPQVAYVYVTSPQGDTLLDAFPESLLEQEVPPRMEELQLLESREITLLIYGDQIESIREVKLLEPVQTAQQTFAAGETFLEASVVLAKQEAPLARLVVLFDQRYEEAQLWAQLTTFAWAVPGILVVSLLLAWILARRYSRSIDGLTQVIEREAFRWREQRDLSSETVNWSAYQMNSAELERLVKAMQVYQQVLIELLQERAAAATVITRTNTELEQANEALRESQRQLRQSTRLATMGEVLGMVAHQWRQPLSVISTLVQAMTLKKQLGRITDEDLLSGLKQVEEQTDYLSQTINDFRGMLRSDAPPQPTDLALICRQALMLQDSRIQQAHVATELALQSVEKVTTLPNELLQVLMSLIGNALDVMAEAPRKILTIRTSASTPWGCIEVEDTGGGIPKQLMERIFEPYFTTKPEREGTGLGLHMSKVIVEQHLRGKLTVTNAEEGACFHILLPLDSPVTENLLQSDSNHG